MSTRPPNDGTNPLDHVALRYLRQALDTTHPNDEPYVLNAVESRVIRQTKVITLTIAALLGVAGILLLYGPQYLWPDLFIDTALSFFGNTYQLPLLIPIYALLLIYVEINLLTALNMRGVKIIMRVCQFPRAHDAQYDRHLQTLANAALEKTRLRFVHFGIDPYLDIPHWGLSLFFAFTVIKAALSNLVLTVLLKPFVGRFALRPLTNLAGMPIYAVWNAWASWQVLHEAQIRVMAPTTIREFVHELYDQWGKQDEFRPLILEALQYVAILERQHNYAHFLLTETLVDRFDLQPSATVSTNFPERVLAAPPIIRQSLERLIIFGVLIDGKLSWPEKRRLRELRNKGLLSYSASDVQRLGRAYKQGRGLWV